ncbi:hypothetical protein [Dehalobacter sp.]|nr:hypothetical protein [Dehalobacter sp.]MDJ0306629.1 hypothetical protein [Dehalobacter sp.]
MAPKNLKHKAILTLVYSAGLRVSEVSSLKIKILTTTECSFISGKG